MLKIKDMNSNSVIRQGDTQPREYQLDTGNLDLNLTNKSATIRLMTGDYKGIAYETTATVSSENKISFSIDDVIPAREYRLEITVDDYVFPSRATDGRFDIDPSSHGQEVNIIQIIGKDEIVRDVKEQVEDGLQPFLGEIEQAELDRETAEGERETAEGERDTAEVQRKADHANRSAEFDGKADKVVLKNLVENGNFSEGTKGWDTGVYRAEFEVIDGVAKTINFDASNRSFIQKLPEQPNIGDMMYVSINTRVDHPDKLINMHILSNYALTDKTRIAGPIANITREFMSLSGTLRCEGEFRLRVFYTFNEIGEYPAYLKDVVAINLTQTFGAGNEPTKEEMDELIKVIGYIDEEYALNNKEMLGYLMNSVGEKANKKQEEWITPTLMNGFVGVAGNEPKYMKDELGFVHIKGRVMGGALNVAIFVLPLGYRPSSGFVVPVYVSDSADFGRVDIGRFGSVFSFHRTTSPVYIDLSCIPSFKAEG